METIVVSLISAVSRANRLTTLIYNELKTINAWHASVFCEQKVDGAR